MTPSPLRSTCRPPSASKTRGPTPTRVTREMTAASTHPEMRGKRKEAGQAASVAASRGHVLLLRARTRPRERLKDVVDLLVEEVVLAVDAVAVHGEQDRDAVPGRPAIWAGSPPAFSHSDKAA